MPSTFRRWAILLSPALLALLPGADALDFSFSELSCSRSTYQYALKANWEARATNLIINHQDETVSVIDVQPDKRSGTGSFDSSVITEAAKYDFSVFLAGDTCDLFATDGSCYVDGQNTLFALKISQEATCADNGGQGTNDADVTPSMGPQDSVTGGADASAPTQGLVPDAALSTLAFVTTVTKAGATATSLPSDTTSTQTSEGASSTIPASSSAVRQYSATTTVASLGFAMLMAAITLTF